MFMCYINKGFSLSQNFISFRDNILNSFHKLLNNYELMMHLM